MWTLRGSGLVCTLDMHKGFVRAGAYTPSCTHARNHHLHCRYTDQCALRDANPDNRLLAMRGNAGTHDLGLGARTVEALRGLSKPGTSMQVPR